MIDSDFTTCPNCKQPVGSSKLDLHQSYCLRFNVFCELCQSAYDKRTDPQHPSLHLKQQCKHCSKDFQKLHIASHSKKCLNQHLCPYCELTVNSEIAKHILACGARTDTCELCKQPYKKSEASEHEKNCVGYQETPRSSKRSAFEASFESFYESQRSQVSESAKSKFQRYLRKKQGLKQGSDQMFEKVSKKAKKESKKPQERFFDDYAAEEYDAELNEMILRSINQF